MSLSEGITQPQPVINPSRFSDHNGTLEFHMAASTSVDQENQDINMADKEEPDKYLLIIAHFLDGHVNDTNAIDRYNGPVLKASIKNVYWIFIIQYAILAMTGIVMNIAIIAYIMYQRLYKDVTHAFIVNLAFCHFVQCAVVLPISLMVMLIQNWIFGQFLCFFLPMLQDIPLHVAMITHILIAWDRMRWLGDPLKGRFPAFVCCCATWLTGMVIALPYPIYTIYVEIGDFIPRLNGMGLCVMNLMDDMHEYVRGLFLLMYCAPTVLLAYLYIRTSQELRPPEAPLAVMLYEHRVDIRMRQRNSSASSVDRTYSGATTATIGGSSSMAPYSTGTATRSYDLYSAEWDVNREKRNQRNFGTMAAVQVICVCPLMILRFARLSIEETYENQKHFDFTYLMFVWIAFLPTVVFPCVYASQILPREEQVRLRGYFRLSSKRLSSKCLKKQVNEGGGAVVRALEFSDGSTPTSREDSVEKNGNTRTTQTAAVVLNGDGCMSGGSGGRSAALKGAITSRLDNNKKSGEYQHHSLCNENMRDGVGRMPPPRHGKGVKSSKNNEYVANAANNNYHEVKQYKRNKGSLRDESVSVGSGNARSSSEQQNDVRNNIISDGKAKASTQKRISSIDDSIGRPACVGGGQRKLTLESLDNRSFSNLTSSTYCNGNGSLLDDGDISNFADGENSSIVSGMILQASSTGSSTGLPPYYEKKPTGMSIYSSSALRARDVSFDDSSSFSQMDSSSTLAREMEIMDILERERSNLDMQEVLKRDKNNESMRRREGERRKLPDIEKICRKSPKLKVEPYSYELSNNTSITSLSAKVPTSTDPLRTTDSFSLSSHLDEDDASLSLPYDKENIHAKKSSEKSSIDEEVPSDFFDDYTPGDASAILPPSVPVVSNAVQYQYSRRLSRKPLHHTPGSSASHHHHNHRMSKRDSFNSLNSNDLIAGAFGELDPTQPLTKMSVIENRVVRRSGSSSGRTSSFSSSARSSMKSRDFGHGSSHSTHPELDFRENFLADL